MPSIGKVMVPPMTASCRPRGVLGQFVQVFGLLSDMSKIQASSLASPFPFGKSPLTMKSLSNGQKIYYEL